MAIAVMRKLRLAAMLGERDAILDALQKTGAVEIKPLKDDVPTGDAFARRYEEAEAALEELTSSLARYKKADAAKNYTPVKDGFTVSHGEFMNALSTQGEMEEMIQRINALREERAALNTALTSLTKDLETALPYKSLTVPFSSFEDGAHTRLFLGVLNSTEELVLPSLAEESVLSEENGKVVLVATHASVAAETEETLRAAGFLFCPYREEKRSGSELYLALQEEERETAARWEANLSELAALGANERQLKLYCDRLAYEAEKEELSGKLLTTERTVILEGYFPSGKEEEIAAALDGVTDAVYYTFEDTAKGEKVPTMMKNNKVAKNFEAITNLYSPPNARELDPTTVMGFFYSLFLGFIMADIGYGLFMLIGGGVLWWMRRQKDDGLKRLAAVFSIGGLFAVIWGVLFNSLFGAEILPVRIMPPLMGDGTNWNVVGIGIPALLIIAMELGVLQIFTGYLCKAIQAWRRGNVWDGIFDGMVWAIFSVGVGLAIVGLTEEAGLPILAIVGGIMAAASLVVAMLTAGRKEKLLGKFTKGFGAAYGVISYASDILSYARLYGLMLSGAVIAGIVTEYAVTGHNGGTGMILSGNIGLIVLGVVLLVVGHVLNLALSLLGAYIHDARLQYVEFYGRFYEGDGELFTPFGSGQHHVFIAPEAK